MTTHVLAHSVKIRPGLPSDIEPCARILFNAFGAIAAHHNFPPDIPSIEVSTELMTMLLTHPHFFSVVAELNGKIVGSNFLDERSAIAGVGPITVDPSVQNRGLGRRLMEAVLDRAGERPIQACDCSSPPITVGRWRYTLRWALKCAKELLACKAPR